LRNVCKDVAPGSKSARIFIDNNEEEKYISKNEFKDYNAAMSSRSAAPRDLKEPEVTQQNLTKGEKGNDNEWVPYISSPPFCSSVFYV
jgi:hypothetical protein